MINWTHREHRETKNAYRSLAGNTCEKWPFGKWRRRWELVSFPLESYCPDLPASFLSSSDVRYQILQFRTGLLNDSEICYKLIFLIHNAFLQYLLTAISYNHQTALTASETDVRFWKVPAGACLIQHYHSLYISYQSVPYYFLLNLHPSWW
jgi:hypothetical protein